MKIDSLQEHGIPEVFVEKFKEQGIKKLYDPQKKSLKKGLLDFKNQVVAAPTASGKTFIATLAAIKKLTNERSKVIYLVPLIALAGEKWNYYKKLFSKSGFRVAISTGDFDSTSDWLANYDFIIMTTEKCDSLMRHGANWINEIGLIIVDEVHLLNDPSRGPTLEVTLTRLRETVSNAQLLCLSATISNVDEISEWLNAESIKSDFRPVELHEGIYHDNKIQFFGRDDYDLEEKISAEKAILGNTVELHKQALYFLSTRRNTESLARRLGSFNKKFLKKNEKEELKKLSDELLNVLEKPTRQCKKLADYVKNGVVFHHAGLLGKQKSLIEDNFRKGLIRAICATPTLAMGVNLPAFRVIVRDIKRYYAGYGMRYIPVLEYKQFVGRAGRPDYDDFGESILVAKSETDAHRLTETYIFGEPEDVYSKLSLEPVLRMHTLALIASGFINSREGLMKFFRKTFYAYQYGEMTDIEMKLDKILEMLFNFRFLQEKGDKIVPTKIGKRVSELYLDPITAYHFVKGLKKSNESTPIFSLIHVVSNTLEMRPLLRIGKNEYDEINDKIAKSVFLEKVPEDWDINYDKFMQSVKTAMLFESWIEEVTEDKLLSKYRVAPGDLYYKLKNADWLLYSLNEMGLLLGKKKVLGKIRKLRVRTKYGVREELLPLVRLKKIGRVRARTLFDHNLKSVSDLRKVPLPSLSRIIGPKIANSIKKQLGEDHKEIKDEKQMTLG
ncbi:MAG: DEAD/DEAH box helicase [Candidatus Aenigmarchaeota archaeon]|nr:DEAD/DEAH box helicase [Candidatus Aenigmarchaeota archaeon]